MTGLGAVQDVGYLLATHRTGAAALDRALVYRYRSGRLLRAMMDTLRCTAEQQGRILASGDLPLRPGFADGGLLNVLPVFRWSREAVRRLGFRECASSLRVLAEGTHGPSVHLVPHDSPVLRHSTWPTIEAGALVVEEPLITRASLPAALLYLAETSDLNVPPDIVGQRGFVESFADFIDEVSNKEVRARGLAPLIKAFDERILLSTDCATNRFDPVRYRLDKPPEQRRSTLQHQMREFLRQGTEHGLVALLQGFDARRTQQGRSARAVVGDLYRVTARLLEPAPPSRAEVSPGITDGMAVPGDVVLWAALVLAWQPVIEDVVHEEADYRRRPDRLESTLHALGRDFLARRATRTADPLDNRWSGISRALEAFIEQAADRSYDDDDRPEVSPYESWVSNCDFVQTLADALGAKRDAGPWWVRHLHVGLIAARASTKTPAGVVPQSRRLVEVTTLQLPVRRFCDVVGRGGAVHALRRHVLDDDGANVLLYGPDGVGRRTLAHLLAKARLCEASDRTLAPCGACPACEGYKNGAFGQFWIDGADRERRKRVTEYIVETLPVTGFSRCRTVVIENADHYPPSLFDQSLQSMEIDHGATFILLARTGTPFAWPDGRVATTIGYAR